MLKPLIAMVSLLAGSAAAAATVEVQTDGSAFTGSSPERYWTPDMFARRFELPPPTYVEIEVEGGAPEEVVQRNRKPTSAGTSSRTRPGERRALAPCSLWRDVGVKAVAGPDGPELRHVRRLCP